MIGLLDYKDKDGKFWPAVLVPSDSDRLTWIKHTTLVDTKATFTAVLNAFESEKLEQEGHFAPPGSQTKEDDAVAALWISDQARALYWGLDDVPTAAESLITLAKSCNLPLTKLALRVASSPNLFATLLAEFSSRIDYSVRRDDAQVAQLAPRYFLEHGSGSVFRKICIEHLNWGFRMRGDELVECLISRETTREAWSALTRELDVERHLQPALRKCASVVVLLELELPTIADFPRALVQLVCSYLPGFAQIKLDQQDAERGAAVFEPAAAESSNTGADTFAFSFGVEPLACTAQFELVSASSFVFGESSQASDSDSRNSFRFGDVDADVKPSGDCSSPRARVLTFFVKSVAGASRASSGFDAPPTLKFGSQFDFGASNGEVSFNFDALSDASPSASAGTG